MPAILTRFRVIVLAVMALAALSVVPAVMAQGGGFEPADCPFEIPASQTVECGYLTVPEDRSDPNSPDIRLAVAIVRAPNQPALPDPIVYLEGGPGGSALTGIDAWYDTDYGQNRDIVLIDQRGTGYSEPGLFCFEFGEDEVEDTEICRDDLEAQGIDLSAYTSAANAADIEDLRLALGYEQINLYGISYGTRLAMTVMRDYPDGLRSVVLDSPYPPAADAFNEDGVNFYYVLTTLAADCAADADCNAAFPDIEGFFIDLVEQANANPIEFDGELLAGGDIIEMFYGYFYDTMIIPYLPAIMYDIPDGSVDALIAYEETLDIDMGDDDMMMDEDFIDFDAMSDEEFSDFLMEALGYDDVDELADYLDSLTDDEYFALLDELSMGAMDSAVDEMMGEDVVDFDAMTDEEFDDYLMQALGYATLDDLYDYLDTLTDDEYFALLDELAGVEGGEDDIDRSDASGMFNSVTCAEEIPFSTLDQQATLLANTPPVIQEHFRNGFVSSIDVCAAWGVALSGAIEDEIVVSDVPTLILVGQYDVATPPMWADLSAEGLSNATLLEFPGGGHAIIDAFGCATEVGTAFIDAPESAVDSSCVSAIGAPEFYVP